jgi:Mrp family chromosome partitioning ATPase
VLATIPGLEPARPWYRRLLPATVSANLALEAAASDFAIPAPPSPYVDALYRLRANLLLVPGGHAPRVITVTSATDAPGRSHRPAPDALYTEETAHSLALSLAAVLAQHGERVLCVDANLRSARPAGAQPVEPGLSDLLAGGQSLAFGHPSDPLLSVLPAGSRPPAPAELIASTRMSTLLARWCEEFSFVILDSAPAIYADALILAQQSDAVLLTACAGRTRHEAIQSAHRALTRQMPEQAVLGLVLEDAPDGGSLASA